MIPLGRYFLNDTGQTGQIVQLPDNTGTLRDMLTWGYGAMPSPSAGAWIETPDLRAAPYNVPAGATGVRFHIKAKCKTIKWSTVDSLADIQVAVSADGLPSQNECIHATACMKGNDNLPGEQISHATVDVPLGVNGTVRVFHYPSIIGYANADLIVYLAGWWADEAPSGSVLDALVAEIGALQANPA